MKSKLLRFAWSALILVMLLTAFSCKSKKKLAEQEAEKARMEQMEADRKAREEREEQERLAREEAERKAREAREAKAAKEGAKQQLNRYFNAISNATSPSSAESSINEALRLFSSSEAPVLIIIYENAQENVTDYDEPTTIQKYLQYLKLTKNKAAMVDQVTYDDNGKITELVLKKDF